MGISRKKMIFVHSIMNLIVSGCSVEGDRFLPRDRSKPDPVESTYLSTDHLAQKERVLPVAFTNEEELTCYRSYTSKAFQTDKM